MEYRVESLNQTVQQQRQILLEQVIILILRVKGFVGNESVEVATAKNVGIASSTFIFLHLQNLTFQLNGVTPGLISLARCNDSGLT